jgi:hypothetical protein
MHRIAWRNAVEAQRQSSRLVVASGLIFCALVNLLGAGSVPSLPDGLAIIVELGAGAALLLADEERLFAVVFAAVMAAIRYRAARYGLLPAESCAALLDRLQRLLPAAQAARA